MYFSLILLVFPHSRRDTTEKWSSYQIKKEQQGSQRLERRRNARKRTEREEFINEWHSDRVQFFRDSHETCSSIVKRLALRGTVVFRNRGVSGITLCAEDRVRDSGWRNEDLWEHSLREASFSYPVDELSRTTSQWIFIQLEIARISMKTDCKAAHIILSSGARDVVVRWKFSCEILSDFLD